jgi:hypothetical protein
MKNRLIAAVAVIAVILIGVSALVTDAAVEEGPLIAGFTALVGAAIAIGGVGGGGGGGGGWFGGNGGGNGG